MQDPFDPDLLTPEERTREVAGLLATGYLRLRELRAAPGGAATSAVLAPYPGRQRENDLDARGDRSVHVPRQGGA